MASYSDAPPVILDTNILIYSAAEPYDIEFTLRKKGVFFIKVPSFVIRELEYLCSGKRTKASKLAKLALQIALRFEVMHVQVEGRDVDEKVLNLAKRHGYAVATADTMLRRRLMDAQVPVIYFKDGRLVTEDLSL